MNRRAPRVLMYHGFGHRPPPTDPHHLFVPLDDLELQLGVLTRWFRPLDLDGYLAGFVRGRWPARSVLVTIDDGYRSTLTDAAPVLARHGVPAVLFVPPGRLGATSSWMPEMPDELLLEPGELSVLAHHGIEVGVHGMDHRLLLDLPAAELARQVTEARVALADLTGERPRSFAYPSGAFDAATADAVRREGYEVAFSVDQGGHGRYSVTRRPVNTRDSLSAFAAKLLPGYEWLWARSRGHPRVRRLAATLARQRPSGASDPAPSG